MPYCNILSSFVISQSCQECRILGIYIPLLVIICTNIKYLIHSCTGISHKGIIVRCNKCCEK
ncbi:hypothetical protein L873DRAFT_968891 [Choiromyces venosus 120613-1]|uniref:Uncharacterized protein n=1 Tax=Choiromyces venosus 120613-1 TaxID=1336337 RepID=A0A3N4K7T7_9PEZI|nr:hypothetical protein L873DRAFT_968891 [Choiromyces venosus 120613-1]